MNEKPSSCEGCPAYAYGVGFVKPAGRVDKCRYVVIGQGPGEVEANSNVPFHPNAPAGRTLTRWLGSAGISRHDCTIMNVVWCWMPKYYTKAGTPQKNRAPTGDEIRYCWETHGKPFIGTIGREVELITVGHPATAWVMFGRVADERESLGVDKYMGTLNEVDL